MFAIASQGGTGGAVVVASEAYTPTISSSGAGVIGLLGDWRAIRVGNIVQVIGAFEFAPAVAGVGETLTFTLPPGMLPAANFAVYTDLTGPVPGDVALSTGAGPCFATVGAKTGEAAMKAGLGSVQYAFAFSYSI